MDSYLKVIDILISLNCLNSIRYQFIAKSIDTPILGFGNCNLSCSTRNISDLPACLYKLISKEHALVTKELLSEFTLDLEIVLK